MTALANLKLTTGVGVEWRETVADAIYALPDVPVPDTAGHGSHYGALTVSSERITTSLLTSRWRSNTFIFRSARPVVSVGGHDTDTSAPKYDMAW